MTERGARLPGELLAELLGRELRVAELAAARKLSRVQIQRALDAALGAPATPAPGCIAAWELAVYLTGRDDVTRSRRRSLAAHLAACVGCRAASAGVAAALDRAWEAASAGASLPDPG